MYIHTRMYMHMHMYMHLYVYIYMHMYVFKSCLRICLFVCLSIHLFLNSVSLGSSAIVKVLEQVRAAQIRTPKVLKFPGRGSQARFTGRRAQRFPKVPKGSHRFLKIPKSFQEQVPN